MCGNKSINEQPENKDIVAYNDRVDENFTKRLQAWNDYLDKKEKCKGNDKPPAFPDDPINPTKKIKRMPVKPAYRSPVLQCMCSMSQCVMRGSDVASTCPIGCINKSNPDHARYEFDSTCKRLPPPLFLAPDYILSTKHQVGETGKFTLR